MTDDDPPPFTPLEQSCTFDDDDEPAAFSSFASMPDEDDALALSRVITNRYEPAAPRVITQQYVPADPAPRYDEVFAAGVASLDADNPAQRFDGGHLSQHTLDALHATAGNGHASAAPATAQRCERLTLEPCPLEGVTQQCAALTTSLEWAVGCIDGIGGYLPSSDQEQLRAARGVLRGKR